MMDADVIPPKDAIEQLISCEKDIVSGVYYNYFMSSGQLKILPVAWASISEKEFEEFKKQVEFSPSVKSHLDLQRHLTKEEVDSEKLFKVVYPSAGCMLISRKVFEKINYDLINEKFADDISFIKKASEKGFEPYCFTKVKCDHLVSGKYEKDSKGNLVHTLFK